MDTKYLILIYLWVGVEFVLFCDYVVVFWKVNKR